MNHVYVITIILTISACTSKEVRYEIGQIRTDKGEVLIWLYDETPNHKAMFIKLANAGYWDSLSFNRVIKNFVAQGGCPDTPEGFSDSPYLIKPEFNSNILHDYGAFAAGRDNNKEMISAGCQFYIVQNKQGVHRLDNQYTVYGKVIKGMNVIDEIVHVQTDSTDAPINTIRVDVNVIKLTAYQLEKVGFIVDRVNENK